MEEQTLQLNAKPEVAAPEVAGAQRVPDVSAGELARRRYVDVIGAKLDDGLVRIDLTATSEGQTVLGKAQAVVRLA